MKRSALFPLGQIAATPGALDMMSARHIDHLALLVRHVSGDWGDLDVEDRASNDRAISQRTRILSSYDFGPGVRIWIITEGDRSVTTILLPEEY